MIYAVWTGEHQQEAHNLLDPDGSILEPLPLERHLQQTFYFQLCEKNACLEIRSLVEPGLIRLIWDQKIARSNRAAPTKMEDYKSNWYLSDLENPDA